MYPCTEKRAVHHPARGVAFVICCSCDAGAWFWPRASTMDMVLWHLLVNKRYFAAVAGGGREGQAPVRQHEGVVVNSAAATAHGLLAFACCYARVRTQDLADVQVVEVYEWHSPDR